MTIATDAHVGSVLPASLPGGLHRRLARVERRIRRVHILRGLGLIGLVLAVGILAGIALDLAFVLPNGVRWAAWGLTLALAAWLLLVQVVRPLLRRHATVDIAAVAERGNPSLGEQVSTAAALLQARGQAHGAPSLIAAAVEGAAARAREVDPVRAVPTRRAWTRLSQGVLALSLVVLPAAIWPDPCATLLRRVAMPWTNPQRIGRYVVTIRGGDRHVAIGDDVPVTADVRPRFGSSASTEPAVLEWTAADGQTQQVAMARLGDPDRGTQTWQLTLPHVPGSLQLRAAAESVRSPSVHIQAWPAPEVANLQIEVVAPAYLKRPPAVLENPTRFEAWQDSIVTLRLTANRPMFTVSLTWPEEGQGQGEDSRSRVAARSHPLDQQDRESLNWQISLPARESGDFSINLKDVHGLVNRASPPRELKVRRDLPPEVALGGPAPEVSEQARPDDFLTAPLVASDDVAVARAELHYAIQHAARPPGTAPETGLIALEVPGLGTPRVRGDAGVNLAPLRLVTGDTFTYRLRVVDNCPPPRGPHEAWTVERQLAISADAQPLLARRQTAEKARLQEALNALKKAVLENRQATTPLRNAAVAAQRDPQSWDALKQQDLRERESKARELIDSIEKFARDASKERTFAAVARPAQKIAEVEAAASREALAQAARRTDPAQRAQDLADAENRQAAVQNRLEELQRVLDKANQADEDRRKLAALAARQDELARRAGQQAAAPVPDRAALDQLQVEQNRLNQELASLLQRAPELAAEALAARAAAANDLAAKARELAERQREEARQTADLSARAPELKAIIEAQQALEADARRLALAVDRPLTENERGGLNVQALAEPVAPLERAALDEARQRLDQAENELRRLTRDIDEVGQDPRGLARRLLRRQDELGEQVRQALRESVQNRDEPSDAERVELQKRLDPLRARQQAIAGLVAALPVATDRQDRLKEAIERQKQAAEDMNAGTLKNLEDRQNQARRSLQELANALPDPNQARNEARERIEEARRRTEQVANELERHLRETAPQPGQPYRPDQAAADLANRLEPLARIQAEAAADVEALKLSEALVPQQTRFQERAQRLADGLARADRAALPALLRDARAAASRLSQKFDGRGPADEAAAELADEAAALAQGQPPAAETKPAETAQRLATALRGLDVPDAEIERGLAVQAAEQAQAAARGPDAPAAKAALEAVAQAVAALARRVSDEASAREQVANLAHAERAVDAAEQPAEAARSQKEVAQQLARLQASIHRTDAPQPSEALRAAQRAVDRAADLARKLAEPPPPPSLSPSPAAASASQAEAARRLDQLAESLPAEPSQQPEMERPQNPRGKAEELAKAQRQLLGDMEAVQKQARDNPDRNAARAALPAQLAPLRERQLDLARQAQALDDPRPARDPEHREAERRQGHARVSQERTLEAIDRRDPDQSVEQARAAAERMEQLAQALPSEQPPADPAAAAVPGDPELGLPPERAEEARQLARRQRQVRERLQGLLADRVPPQQQLRDESTDLGHDFARLQQQTQPLHPQAAGAAGQAANLLTQQAPRDMGQGIDQLQQAQASAARDSQRRAAENLERAAQQAEDVANALRSKAPLGASHEKGAQALSQAMDAQQRATEQLAQARDPSQRASSAGQAEQAMQQAADQLRTASASKPSQDGQPGEESLAEDAPPSGQPPTDTTHSISEPTPMPAPAGTAEAELAELQQQIRTRTGRSWGELPGHLRSEILRMARAGYRDDYARLIQLYFREIASGTPGQPSGER